MGALAVGAWEFLKRLTPAQILCITLGALLLVQTCRIEGIKVWPLQIPGLKAELQSARDDLKKEKDARARDRATYQAAQDAAAIQNRKEVAEKESEYRSINERVKNAYQTDLARARADYARRMQSQGGAVEGAPCTTGTPENPCPSAGANGSAYVRIPYASGLLGAETELKLIHLQEWVRKQLEAQP